jgi:hypothetical protein
LCCKIWRIWREDSQNCKATLLTRKTKNKTENVNEFMGKCCFMKNELN